MPLRSIARLIQTMLYARRFFPFYVYNILGGIEDDGMLLHLLVRVHKLLFDNHLLLHFLDMFRRLTSCHVYRLRCRVLI